MGEFVEVQVPKKKIVVRIVRIQRKSGKNSGADMYELFFDGADVDAEYLITKGGKEVVDPACNEPVMLWFASRDPKMEIAERVARAAAVPLEKGKSVKEVKETLDVVTSEIGEKLGDIEEAIDLLEKLK